jgi:hypothetical protein
MIHLALLCCLLSGDGDIGQRPNAERAEPYEALQSDAAWCGPRILYFFSCYFRQERTLHEVVELCKPDERGYVTLQQLVQAAQQIGLEPLPLGCSADEVLDLGGPAILCVRASAGSSPEDSSEPVHFIGVVGRQGDEYWVVDPAQSTRAMRVSRAQIASAFTGHAVLLKGCPRPELLAWWLRGPTLLVSSVAALLLLALYFTQRWSTRSGAASGGCS